MNRPPASRVAHSPQPLVAALAVLAVAGYVTAVLWSAGRLTYNVWAALLLLPLLWVLGAFILHRRTSHRAHRWLFQVALVALTLKLIGGVLRYEMAWGLYSGSDAGYYHDFALLAAPEYRFLDFSRDFPFGDIPGTGFMFALTAVIYALVGPTMIGGYVVCAFLGFWGQWLAYLGFRSAVPEGNHRRYALLVLLLPSLIFWPSALGKDAWMQLTIGLAIWGVGNLSTRAGPAWAAISAGVLGAGLIRPHISAILAIALAGALLLRRPRRVTSFTPVVRIVASALVIAGGLAVALRGGAFVGVESLTFDNVRGAMEDASGRTDQGGSEFTPVPLLSPLGLPAALLTVLFRPLPFDAHNVPALMAAVEGTVLLWLAWCWRWSLASALTRLRSSVFVATAVIATLLFVMAFSEFANFGIVVRQRAQVLPFFLALLCLPSLREQRLDPRVLFTSTRRLQPERTP